MKNRSIIAAKVLFLITAYKAQALSTISRNDIVKYASSAAGSRYIFGGSKWDPSNRRFGGSDCAGLVLKAWRWPLEVPFQSPLLGAYRIDGRSVPGKLYTGTMLQNEKFNFPWSKSKDLSSLQLADALTYNNGSQGHTFIYLANNNGMIRSIEARSSKSGIGYFERSISAIKRTGYYVLKRKNIRG